MAIGVMSELLVSALRWCVCPSCLPIACDDAKILKVLEAISAKVREGYRWGQPNVSAVNVQLSALLWHKKP
jgi:hypothetical protein